MKFEITVQDERKINSKLDDSDESYGAVQYDSVRKQTIKLLRDWLENDQLREREGLIVLGMHLYQVIFNGQIATDYENALKESRRKKETLRVQLRFQPEALALSTLPWEFLYRPESDTSAGYFLSTKTELTLFRYMPSKLDDSGDAVTPLTVPLRVLVVFAEPEPANGEPPSQHLEIEQDMESTFKRLNIHMRFLDCPTTESLPEALDEFNPHILHYIGHGIVRNNDEYRIGLLDTQKKLKFIPDKLFAEIVRNTSQRDLRLIFLHLNDCKHQEQLPNNTFPTSLANFAPALILANIPAVVSMQFPVSYKLAKKFYAIFYRDLAEGKSIDLAVQKGRESINLDSDFCLTHYFGTPVLYANSVLYNNKQGNIVEQVLKEPDAGTKSKENQPSLQDRLHHPTAKDSPPPKLEEPARPAVDLSALRGKVSAKLKEASFTQEQEGVIGNLMNLLYKEKISKRENYQQVVQEALFNNSQDWKLQDVIAFMLDEVGGAI